MLKIGDKAPNFTLKDHNKNDVSLSDYKGRKVLLSFHPLAWTKICAEQMKSLETNFQQFKDSKTIALGMSIDTVPSKNAWAKTLDIEKTRLVSDFWPHGGVAKRYDLFREKDGFSERANVIIDEEQNVAFIKIYEISQLPDIDEILDFLKQWKGAYTMNEETKTKLDVLLTEAMNAEVKAKKFYTEAAEKASSNAGKNLFKELADFEQGHYDRLKKIIESRTQGLKIQSPTISEEIPVKAEVEGEFEPNKDEIVKVLGLGIEAEKKAQAKYREIAKLFEDEEAKKLFSNMAEEERKHQTILENQFYSMSNTGKIIWGD